MAKVAKKKSKNVVAKKKVASKKTVARKIPPRTKPIAAKKKASPKKRVAPKKSAAKTSPAKRPVARKPVAKKPGLKKTNLPKRPPAERDVIDEQALRARSTRRRKDGANAFLPDPSSIGHRRVKDDFAEGLGEEFVATATSGESADDERDATTPEEDGGPFVTTSAKNEFGQGTDASNPADAEREPFPTTHGERR